MMDTIDRILIENAKKYMIEFDINKFKKEYPRLYITIRESMNQFKQKGESILDFPFFF
jgi:hypothetical protein